MLRIHCMVHLTTQGSATLSPKAVSGQVSSPRSCPPCALHMSAHRPAAIWSTATATMAWTRPCKSFSPSAVSHTTTGSSAPAAERIVYLTWEE